MEAGRSRQRKRACVVAWLVALAAARGAGPARACDAPPSAPATSAQGMVVPRDPKTGKLGVPPPDTVPFAARQAAPSAPVALPETPGTTPAGGGKVDLQGTLDSPMRATIGFEGKAPLEGVPPAFAGTRG